MSQSAGIALRPIEHDFLEVTARAVGRRDQVAEFVRSVRDSIDSVVYIGTGGSLASSMHAVYTLKRHLKDLYVDNLVSAEVVADLPARIGPRTLVIASSHSGGTPETVAATELVKQTGATIITLSSETDTPLGRLADLALGYGSDRTITSPKQILLSHITWALLDGIVAADEIADVRAAYDALPEALRHALSEAEDELAGIAKDLVGSPYVYVLSAGPNLGGGYLLSMCYLMEMQWTRSASFNAGEFFHGAFEMVVPDAAVLTFLGEDATRPLSERAARFASTYSSHAHEFDTTTYTLPGIAPAQRGEVTPILLGVLAARLADQLEAASGHNLDDRRYMYKVEY